MQVGKYYLDSSQQKIVLDNSKHILVVAGAGSGKTLTILGKIKYLVEEKNINPEDILCISFTRNSSFSLKEKIKKEFGYNMSIYTFHKLALEILKENNTYEIAGSDTLENIIHEFLTITILDYPNYIRMILAYFKIKKRKNIEKYYQNFCIKNKKQLELLEKLLSTFLHLFKCNNYSLSDFTLFLHKIKRTLLYFTYKQEKIFLILALNIYLQYQKYLDNNNEIDFDDMIIKATKKVKEEGINHNFKYVIIDEYQDTSYIRFCLIKEILDKTNANLMVVGDDFQSIYKFTGCDLSLFLNFKKYFNDAKIMKIETTYRNSNELIKIAGNFVMKNKNQIRKYLHSNKQLKNPIQIYYYTNIKTSFKKLIEKIYSDTNKPILILGRNNYDVNKILDQEIILKNDNTLIYKKNENIKMKYMTVHKSKGLEEENVILINLENNLLGFPNKIKDDKVLRLVSNSYEKYLYSEERRLFYVALTRTKNYVYLLTSKNNPSMFVEEIKKDNFLKAKHIL